MGFWQTLILVGFLGCGLVAFIWKAWELRKSVQRDGSRAPSRTRAPPPTEEYAELPEAEEADGEPFKGIAETKAKASAPSFPVSGQPKPEEADITALENALIGEAKKPSRSIDEILGLPPAVQAEPIPEHRGRGRPKGYKYPPKPPAPPSVKAKVYKCPKCSQTFNSPFGLGGHLKAHKKKPFPEVEEGKVVL